MSLSAKFAKFSGPAKTVAGGKKKVGGIVLKKVGSTPNKGTPAGKGKKVNQAIAAQKQKRQAQVQLKRGVASPASGKPGKGKSPKGKSGKSPKGKGPKGGKGKKEGEKKKPVTAEDLDKDIDTYWYKGGKGPNPDLVQLDKEMEEYMKSKPTAESN